MVGETVCGKSISLPRTLLRWAVSPVFPTSGQAVSDPGRPPRLLLWWERLLVWQQLAISFPVFGVFTFLLNLGPFSQPPLRSVYYGVFEGGVLAGLLAVATRTERDRRK